jgi:hypothetical protein
MGDEENRPISSSCPAKGIKSAMKHLDGALPRSRVELMKGMVSARVANAAGYRERLPISDVGCTLALSSLYGRGLPKPRVGSSPPDRRVIGLKSVMAGGGFA